MQSIRYIKYFFDLGTSDLSKIFTLPIILVYKVFDLSKILEAYVSRVGDSSSISGKN